MLGLCKYKNMFGEPGTGVHRHRFLGLAIVDVLQTVLGACIVAYLFDWPVGWTVLAAFVLAIVVHRMFCVRTTIDKLLFPYA
jgi:hypothetical protein